MKIYRKLALLLPLLALPAAAASAETLVKLATLVPSGTPWDQALRQMGDEWTNSTDGRVVLRIYPGGVAGDEPDVMRKLRIGQLQAAAVTVAGLSTIDDGFRVFQVPMLFDSYEELQFVIERLEPTLKERLEGKGLVLLNWGHGGWVHLFSKQEIRTPEQLKKAKLFTWAADTTMVQWWKRNGYDPVPLAATDMLTGLETGMINAFPTTPLAALVMQFGNVAPHMLDVGFAPLVGATVITKRAWEGISEADRRVMREAAEAVEKRVGELIPKQDAESIAAMEARGLQVTRLTEEERAAWESAAEDFASAMRERLIPPEILDAALAARQEFRSR